MPEGIASVLDISIHAPLTGSDVYDKQAEQCVSYISIHAPLTGSDQIIQTRMSQFLDFNPRSPHRERQAHVQVCERPTTYFNPRSPHRERLYIPSITMIIHLFQSTLPSQGATLGRIKNGRTWKNFNPRSPRRERPAAIYPAVTPVTISIHAPLTGSDNQQPQ